MYREDSFDLNSPKNSPYPLVETIDKYCFPLTSYKMGGSKPADSISNEQITSPLIELTA
jgi:hypothetical protein|tara:strand:+ start:141 stop:317 length:177 start_codon:yes stop_codon:yes gene_type:complete